ncbi:MAG: hypothetical protein A2538_05120 [Candidatus Magasanikbacteria bacterium RIFOXYD2_FULL_41_14]|uniref:YtxH domain-containing protein n=1 Tax=Candidatus Magasanikbacteria bacterium RIFOXYD2_FULL_41_14 TaxID=1798709 RepID=A0A1F6PGB5_9BACT|nr:MAG: hypothetical protein A2538_05120 [Candidatus Magasanikbacteria bacterium RIFOXYD2_FULL_41_14]
MKNKFKKGLILGGLLAVGAAAKFVMSKEGQDLTEDLQKDLKTLAKHLKSNLHELEDVTKERYNELVAGVVEEYAKNKELIGDAKDKLVTALQDKWQEMEEAYLEEEKKIEKKK